MVFPSLSKNLVLLLNVILLDAELLFVKVTVANVPSPEADCKSDERDEMDIEYVPSLDTLSVKIINGAVFPSKNEPAVTASTDMPAGISNTSCAEVKFVT